MVTTYQSAYIQFLPLAMQVPEVSIRVFRGDVRLVLVNVRLGMQSVLGSPQQINWVKVHLPMLPMTDMLDLPDLARALVFASGKVIGRRKSDGDIEATLGRVSVLRGQFLHQAEVLANIGKLDKQGIANIRKGRGKYDMAQDGLDLAGVYTEHAGAIAGLHPFTTNDIESLRKDSEWLLEHLTPTGGRKEYVPKSYEADVRDRLWTLMTERHPHLRKIGHYMHGDDFEAHTPKLQSRVSPRALEEVNQGERTSAPITN